MQVFHTTFIPHDRETKAKYVWLKYRQILQGKILDVGADEQYIKNYLCNGDQYVGIGFGNCDVHLDLEKSNIPYPDNEFDVVLCLDVLEHLDNIHHVFDEICRVSNKYVILSLPNPWADLFDMLRNKDYRPGQPMKFYGLPVDRPKDRHKWFFSCLEAENFIKLNAKKNGFEIIQLDYTGKKSEGKTRFKKMIHRFARGIIIRNPELDMKMLYFNTLCALLRKGDN